tara:strand:- start:16 stop:333 length:318 start_codon:yes stop_codon:yes gene_type:complete
MGEIERKIELSVSTRHPTFTCNKLADTLKTSGIQSSLIENYSLVKRDNNINLELGCKIELHNVRPKDIENKVWDPIKKQHGFECGHLWIENKFSGCVYDFFNKLN